VGRLSDKERSVVVELAVIVVGVLIALGLDASWDAAQERRARHELLVALGGDLEAGAELLTEQIAAVQAELDQIQSLLEALYGGDQVDPDLAMEALVSSSDWADLPMGAYLGALNSGQLALLPAELNRELALLPAMQERVTDNVNLFLQNAYFGPYADAVELAGGIGQMLPFGPPAEAGEVNRALRQRAALRGIGQLYVIQFNRLRMLQSLVSRVERLKELVARELA
jgi:hypothetical protein